MPSQPQPNREEPSPPSPSRAGGANAAYDRTPPHDLDAERAVLGSMLQDKEAISDVLAVLRDVGRESFFLEKHQRVYDVLVRLYLRDMPIDGVLVREELVRLGVWESSGEWEFLGTLVNSTPSSLRARHYSEIVLEKHLLRQLIGATHRVMQKAFDDDEPAREVLDYAEKEIFDVTERRVSGEAAPMGDLLIKTAEMFEHRGAEHLTGVPSGFLMLDDLTSGLQRQELIIVAGRPSMGKTAFGLNIAENMSISDGRPVLFFSLEMSKQQVAQRILCSRARVDAHKLRRGRISRQELENLKAIADELAGAPLLVDDTSNLSVLELRARSRMAMRRYQIDAIFVDYLQLMHIPRSESRQQEVATISRGLKALAKDLNVPVIAMAQLNRNTEDKTRKGNRPRMSDLRESGAIEQDADVIMLLHREAYYKTAGEQATEDDNEAEVIIAKQRNGPVDTVKLHFNRQFTRFDNQAFGNRMEDNYAPRVENSGAPF